MNKKVELRKINRKREMKEIKGKIGVNVIGIRNKKCYFKLFWAM